MIQEKLRTLRKQKGISQEQLAKILHTDTSNYSRKERGTIRIRNEEWKKLANVLGVSVDDIKEVAEKCYIKDKNSIFYDNLENYNQYYSIPHSIIENLQDYINILREENKQLKEQLNSLKDNN